MATASSTASHPLESPSPAVGALKRPSLELIAITTHDDFLLELGQSLGGQAVVHPVESVEEAVQSLGSARRGSVLAVDSRAVTEPAVAVQTLSARAPHAVILVFAEVAATEILGQALKGSHVFAVLPLPIDARKTQAVIEGAVAQATQQTATPASHPAQSLGSLAPQAAREAAPAAASHSGEPGAGARGPMLIAAAAAAVALISGTTWYFVGHRQAKPAAVVPAATVAGAPAVTSAPQQQSSPPAADTAVLTGKVDELLEKARLAMHERRFTEPSGDNALLYYRSVVAAEPGNAEARDGLTRVAEVLTRRFDDAMGGSRFDEAASALAGFKAAVPGDARVAGYEQRLYAAAITRALGEGNVERATALMRQAQQSGGVPADQINRWRTELARRQDDAKLAKLAGQAEASIRDGRLTDGDDSAKAYLQQLQSAAPANTNTQRVARELIAAELHKARDAAVARNRVDQDHWLAEARGIGAKRADLASFDKDVADARAKAAAADNDHLLQQARAALRDGHLSEPGQDNAAAYLTQLQAANAGSSPAFNDISHDLANRLLQRARASIAAGKSGDADIAQARRWGADPRELASVQQSAQSASQPAAPDLVALAEKLKRSNSVEPDYPVAAMSRGITGNVVVSFTVDAKGATRDVQVVESTPPGVFDRSAIAAVRRWRYAPALFNGRAVEVPVKARVSFQLAPNGR